MAAGGNTGDPAAGTGSEGGFNFFGTISDSLILMLAVVAVAGLIGYVAWRRHQVGGTSPGLLTRTLALLAVVVTIPLVALGSAQSANRAAAPQGFFGVITQTDLTAADATRMAKGGIESLRLPLAWPSVQPINGEQYNWEVTDQQVGTAARSGITVLPFLYDSPAWVAPSNTRLPVSSLAQRQAWGGFVKAAVARYGTNGQFWTEHGPGSEDPIPTKPIKVWQVWNEANFFYFSNPVSPTQYMTLLEIADKQVNSVDPKAKIMLSGLYGSPPKKEIRSGKAMLADKFLDKLYRLGAKRHFDVAALHPYAPETRSTAVLVNRFRAVMADHGDRGKPFSISEVGWGSSRGGFLDVGSEREQARQVQSAYNYFLSSRRQTKLQSVYWFTWKDKKRSEPSCNFCYSTGFFKAANGLDAKPSWKRFTEFSGGRP